MSPFQVTGQRIEAWTSKKTPVAQIELNKIGENKHHGIYIHNNLFIIKGLQLWLVCTNDSSSNQLSNLGRHQRIL